MLWYFYKRKGFLYHEIFLSFHGMILNSRKWIVKNILRLSFLRSKNSFYGFKLNLADDFIYFVDGIRTIKIGTRKVGKNWRFDLYTTTQRFLFCNENYSGYVKWRYLAVWRVTSVWEFCTLVLSTNGFAHSSFVLLLRWFVQPRFGISCEKKIRLQDCKTIFFHTNRF